MVNESKDSQITSESAGRARWQHRLKAILVAAALVFATVTVYHGLAGHSFISFDDTQYILENYHVRCGLSLEGVKWAFTAFTASNWHPLTWLSHMLDVQLFGMNAGSHHLISLFFHVLNTLLLLWFLMYATGRLWPSAFVAAIFALHPLHIESVAWVSERKDVLSTCLWLLTLLSYAFYTRKPSFRRYVLPLFLFALGLMAKPMLVTLPLILLVLDYWPLARIQAGSSRSRTVVPYALFRRLIVEKLPFVVMSLGSAGLTVFAQHRSISLPREMGLMTLLTNAIVSYGRYAWKMICPTSLTLFYPHPHRPLILAAILVALLIALATFLAVRYRAKYPYLLTGWLWYLITLIPVIGFLQVGDQSHADRYTYIPLIGLFVVIAWGAVSIIERMPSLRTAFAVAACVVLAGAASLTWYNLGFWKDNLTLFTHAIAVTSNNGKMEASLGSCLVEMGRQDEAIPHLEKAIQYGALDGTAHNALGAAYLARGEDEKAIAYFTQAAKYEWADRKAQYNLGAILSKLGRFEQAEDHLRKAVQLDPYYCDAFCLFAIALSETGKHAEAAKAYERALELEPGKALAYYAKGYALTKAGDLPAAATAYLKSLSIGPGYMTYGNLGNVLFVMGRLEDAAQSYRRAIELSPGRADAYYNLAFVLEKLDKKDEAVELLKRGLEINPKDVEAQALYRRLTGTQ
jgi:tetratricopeptide (TPR) repeat protein